MRTLAMSKFVCFFLLVVESKNGVKAVESGSAREDGIARITGTLQDDSHDTAWSTRNLASTSERYSLAIEKSLLDKEHSLTAQRELQQEREGVRMVARFHGLRGRTVARSCAQQILGEIDDLLLIRGDGFCMDILLRSIYIEDVDLDFPAQALPIVEEAVDSTRRRDRKVEEYLQEDADRQVGLRRKPDGDKFRRRDSEVSSWPLEMIQADQVIEASSEATTTGSSGGPFGGLRGNARGNEDEHEEEEIIVCLPDTGVAVDHPDLDPDRTGRITGVSREVFFRPEAMLWDQDKHGHGTGLAGAMAAVTGAAGGTDGDRDSLFQIYSTRALDDDGEGFEWDIREAMLQCIDAGAKIVNLSLGSERMSGAQSRFYRHVVERLGILIIAAAGNAGTSTTAIYPAAHPSVISVSSVDQNGELAASSSFGNQVEFAGPGEHIYTTGFVADTIETTDSTYPCEYALPTAFRAATTVSGELVDCDDGRRKCSDASGGGICFMIQDSESIEDMIRNCIQGGGGGAIVFRNGNTDRLEAASTTMIPVMIGKESTMEDIEDSIGQRVVIGKGNPFYTYSTSSGTSMAAAHITSAAAIVWSRNPSCTNHQIRHALAITATHNSNCDVFYGYGVVQVQDALDWLDEYPCKDWNVPKMSHGGCSTL